MRPAGGGRGTHCYWVCGPPFLQAGVSQNPFEKRWLAMVLLLLGGGRLNASSTGVQAGENGFVMAVGGGVDIPVHRHFAIRVADVEYLLTRFDNASGLAAKQSSVRISTGLVLRFGQR